MNEYPYARVLVYFSAVLHYFVLEKIANNSIRFKDMHVLYI